MKALKECIKYLGNQSGDDTYYLWKALQEISETLDETKKTFNEIDEFNAEIDKGNAEIDKENAEEDIRRKADEYRLSKIESVVRSHNEAIDSGFQIMKNYRYILETKEKGMRDGLVELGWASPEDKRELQMRIDQWRGVAQKQSMVGAENERLKEENEQLKVALEGVEEDLHTIINFEVEV